MLANAFSLSQYHKITLKPLKHCMMILSSALKVPKIWQLKLPNIARSDHHAVVLGLHATELL